MVFDHVIATACAWTIIILYIYLCIWGLNLRLNNINYSYWYFPSSTIIISLYWTSESSLSSSITTSKYLICDSILEVQNSRLCTIQECKRWIGIIFSFSLYTMFVRELSTPIPTPISSSNHIELVTPTLTPTLMFVLKNTEFFILFPPSLPTNSDLYSCLCLHSPIPLVIIRWVTANSRHYSQYFYQCPWPSGMIIQELGQSYYA